MSNKTPWIRTGFSISLFAIGFLICNWMHTYRQVSRETKSNGNNPNIHFIAFPAPSFGDFKAAGFPQHFLVIFREPGSPDTIVFSFLRLISNIGIWSVFLTLALAFDYRTQRAKKLRAENAKTRGFSILDLLVITTVIAALFALYRWHESKREKDKAFANEIVSAGGVVDFSLWLPTWMESLIPTMFLERGLTISGVALSAPDDEMIQRISLTPAERGFMPFKGTKLSDDVIAVFKQWRSDGMLEK